LFAQKELNHQRETPTTIPPPPPPPCNNTNNTNNNNNNNNNWGLETAKRGGGYDIFSWHFRGYPHLNRKKLFVVCTYGKERRRRRPHIATLLGPTQTPPKKTQGVSHIVSLPFTIKSILLRQKKKNYGNSNIFHHAKIYLIFKKILYLKETKILQDIIITL
jgi:hypothetical protein